MYTDGRSVCIDLTGFMHDFCLTIGVEAYRKPANKSPRGSVPWRSKTPVQSVLDSRYRLAHASGSRGRTPRQLGIPPALAAHGQRSDLRRKRGIAALVA